MPVCTSPAALFQHPGARYFGFGIRASLTAASIGIGESSSAIGGTRSLRYFLQGNRIIYAITKVVPASYSSDFAAIPLTEGLHGGGFIPASGGDLMWSFHVGAADGTFNWKEPRKVGSGWGAVAIAFAGDAFA